ncbi:MAG: hypothetical protein R2762_02375 [Bryobacteraceae bacterium]
MARFRRLAVLLAVSAILLGAADWSYFRSGPVEVWTDGDEDTARSTLASFDQLRYWTARILGRDEIEPLWPVRLMVLKKPGERRTAHLELKRDAYTALLGAKDRVPVTWMADYARILLHDDAKVMPRHIEDSLIALLSTMEVTNSRILLGKPPGNPDRDFARMHLFLVDPDWAGRSRVFFSNLQQGAPFDTAYRNAFEKTEKEVEAEVDSYFRAGRFEPQQVSGKALNADRDYRERPGEESRAMLLLADVAGDAKAYTAILNATGKNPDAFEGAGMLLEATQNGSESARAWFRYAVQEKDVEKARLALRKAIDLNPRWAAPHAHWAELETDAGRKVPPLRKSTELDPRNIAYWIALAQAQSDAKDFAGAARSWRSAEIAAPDQKSRAAITAQRKAYDQLRYELEAAEKRRIEEERQRELERLKQEALANIRKAEQKANAGDTPVDPAQKVVEWWDGPKPDVVVTGSLDRIVCGRGANAPAQWSVRDSAGKLHSFRVPDPSRLAIVGAAQVSLGCGLQKPPRRVRVEARKSGEVLTVEFLP